MKTVTCFLALMMVVQTIYCRQVLNNQAVISCLFELGDLNHDKQLSQVELDAVLRKYMSPAEQAIDGLTTHRLLAQCDTDNSQAISWLEATEVPRCLATAQIEGIARWVCSRAKHGDFTFDEYLHVSLAFSDALASGDIFATLKAEVAATMREQSDVRRAIIARMLNEDRLSPDVTHLINSLGSVSNVLVLPVAAAILVMALVFACVL